MDQCPAVKAFADLMNGGDGEPDARPLCHCVMPSMIFICQTQGINRGRRYFACVKERGDPTRCGFFSFDVGQLCEDEKDDETPKCICNIRCATYQIKKNSPDKGKFFWCCGLPIGHPERCEFYQIVGGKPYTPLPQAPDGFICICGEPAAVGTTSHASSIVPNCRNFYRCAKKKCAYFLWASFPVSK